jgi:hypothetical protein
MGKIKIQRLFPTLEHHTGEQKSFVISAKNVNITINGELHKIDNQYYSFTRGVGKVVIERQKIGSVLSWRGTYKKYSVKFMVGETVLVEFEIPENAKLRLDEAEELLK